MKERYRPIGTLGCEYTFLLLESFCSTKANTGPGWFTAAVGQSKSPACPSCAPAYWRLQGDCEQAWEPTSSPARCCTQTSTHTSQMERASKLPHYSYPSSLKGAFLKMKC